jgi:hypothetical protein
MPYTFIVFTLTQQQARATLKAMDYLMAEWRQCGVDTVLTEHKRAAKRRERKYDNAGMVVSEAITLTPAKPDNIPVRLECDLKTMRTICVGLNEYSYELPEGRLRSYYQKLSALLRGQMQVYREINQR